MKNYDVVGLGELLIDFTQNGMSSQGNPVLEANPGGAPCNVLSILSKLGHSTAFIGKVGQDGFGDQLEDAINEVGIDSAGLKRDASVHTTLAVVIKTADGDRDFSFYRNPGADMMLREDEVDEDLIRNTKIFHLGSLSMTDEPVRSATKKALELAEESGCLISFDPNLREPLWNSLDEAREQIMYIMPYADILKISDNEIQWLSGKEDYDEGIAWLKSQFDIPLILLSMGGDGSRAYHGNFRAAAPSAKIIDVIETTGAGDTFFGSILHKVLELGWRTYTEEELTDMLKFANSAAGLITTRKGALRVMPTPDEINAIYLS